MKINKQISFFFILLCDRNYFFHFSSEARIASQTNKNYRYGVSRSDKRNWRGNKKKGLVSPPRFIPSPPPPTRKKYVFEGE